MKREKQYDMFDVATGSCTLGDYLFQRYSENDLTSTFWIDEKDEVDELRPPELTEDGIPGTEPVVIPIQGPRAQKKQEAKPALPQVPKGLEETGAPESKAVVQESEQSSQVQIDGKDGLVSPSQVKEPSPESFRSEGTANSEPSTDSFQSPTSLGDTGEAELATSETPKAPSMEDLLAKFHQATQEYNDRADPIPNSEPESPDTT